MGEGGVGIGGRKKREGGIENPKIGLWGKIPFFVKTGRDTVKET